MKDEVTRAMNIYKNQRWEGTQSIKMTDTAYGAGYKLRGRARVTETGNRKKLSCL